MQETYQEKELRLCKRKTKYPLLVVAERIARADSERTGDDIRAYKCDFCNSFHVGHYKEVLDVKLEELNLVKLRVEENTNYVFSIPENVNSKDIDLVLEYGRLVAHKVAGQPWFDKNGESKYWRELNLIPAFFIRDYDVDQLTAQVEEHKANMIELKEIEPKTVKSLSKMPSVASQKPDLSNVIKELVEYSKPDSSLDAGYFKGFAHVQLTRLLELIAA